MSELLKSGKVGTLINDDEILKEWSSSGLLEGLTPSMKLKTAKALENGAKFLLAEENSKYLQTDWMFDTLFFPVIRRCIAGIDNLGVEKIESRRLCTNEIAEIKKIIMINNFDVKLVAEMLYDNYMKLADVFEDLYGCAAQHMDMQAEVTAHLSDIIIDALCKRARYFDTLITSSGKVIKIE